MTMDHEVLDEGCKNCSALRNEIDKRNAQIEHNNAQQLTGFLTLKQKIIGTDKLIREYQSSKVERDILTRKNEEFVHLIDQLHRDLSIRSQDYTQLCGNAELLRAANSEYEVKVKQLSEEAQKWKSQAEAGHNFTSQLVEKVKILEKYEEEVKQTAAVSRECEKAESKLQTLKGQLKDAKETATKSKRELTKMQKDYTQLVKYAKQWGKIAETQGKLGALQKRFFIKLCDKEARETEDDVDPDNIGANEIDEQSKLLEHLLDDGNGSEPVVTSTDNLPKDTELREGNSASLSKQRGKYSGDSTFSKQSEQSPIRAERRSGQDNGTHSKILSPNKTPPRSITTRARIRTSSQNSISQSSDAENVLEAGKENNKRPGPRTRSRSVKITQLPGPKSPALFHTPEHRSAVVQSTTLKSIDDMPCQSLVSMDTLLMTETVQSHFPTIDFRGSLISAQSQLELPGTQKAFHDDRTNAETSTTLTTESIVGVKPLVNLCEPDVSDDMQKQSSSEAGTGKMDQYGTKAQSEVETTVNASSLFGFDSDSSSDSDVDMIPVPSSKVPSMNKNQDRNILQEISPSLTTGSLDTVDESTSNPSRNLIVEDVQHSPASGTNIQCTNNISRSIFALEANLEINSPTQDSNALKSHQEKTSEFPSQEIAVSFTRSLEEEVKTIIPDTADTQVLNNCSDIGIVSDADEMQKPDNETPTVESSRDTGLPVANEKNIEESAAKPAGIFFKKLDEPSSLLIKDATENDMEPPTREVAEDLASGTEKSDINDVPSSIVALDMDLHVSSSEPDSSMAKPTKEAKSDSSNMEVVLQAPLTLDEEPSTVVREIVQDTTSQHGGDTAVTVEVNQELPSEILTVETDRESELIGVDRENLRESPGVEMDMPFKKHEERIAEQVDSSNEIEDKSLTSKPQQEPTPETGESNSRDAPTNIIALDMDVDITFSQPTLVGAKLIEEENTELSCEDPLSLDESNTVAQGTLNVQDPSEIVNANEDLHSEVSEVKTNQESEPFVVSEETLVEHLCTETDVFSKIQEEAKPPQTDESNISKENMVTQKSLQVPASPMRQPYTTSALRSIFAVDLGLDISSSESDSDSDVTSSTEETGSKLLNAEVANQSPIHLHEGHIATPGSMNVEGPDSHYGCDPVLEKIPNETQPVEISPECELLVVNDENVGESSGMKMDVHPRTQEKQMEGESRGTKMIVLLEEREETNAEKIDESTETEDKSSSGESSQDPVPKMGESDSNMAKPTETKSELPNTEVTPGASFSSDPAPENFVPGSLTVQESDTLTSSPLSNVGSNEDLRGEVLADKINSESRIVSDCNGDDSQESPYGRMDSVSKKREELNTEQVDEARKTDKEMVTIGSPICPALETDESETTNAQSSIFALQLDLEMSSSEPESDTTIHLVQEKSELANKEVIREGTPVGDTPAAVITENVDKQPPFIETDIALETREEPNSQLVCTSTESVEKPPTGIWEQYPAPGPEESDTNNVPCSISALNADLDISSSEPDSDEANAVGERTTELPNSEVNIQLAFPLAEEPSLVVPEKIIVQSSEVIGSGSNLGTGALSNVEADKDLRNEVPIAEVNRESGKVSEDAFASAINEKEEVLNVDESSNKKAAEGEFANKVKTTSNVVEPKLTVCHATSTRQTAVSSSSPNPNSRGIPGHILSSNHRVLSEETPEVDTSIQQDDARPTGAASLRCCPVADVRDGIPANKDGQPLPVHRSRSARESSVSPSISSNLPESVTFPQTTPHTPPQILHPLRSSAFKVPRVPDALPRVSDVISADLTQTYPWGRGITQGVKRSAADDEVAVILKQIRTNIIEIPATVSPLPKSPDPQPTVPAKIEEPKSRFPVLPRCAFNWTGKKLPLSDKLTERFGAYLHPGVQTRVRFRRVSRRLLDIRSPDVLSNCFKGVINFAEAERRPKPTVNSVQPVEDISDLIGLEDNATEPTQKPDTSIPNPNALPETRLPASVSTEEVDEVTLPAPNPTSSSKRKRRVTPIRPKATAPALFGSSSSESECESTVVSDSESFQEQVTKRATTKNLNEKKLEVVPSKKSMQTPSLVNTSRAQVLAQLIEPIVPLGRANRSDFTPIKANEARRETESMFNPSRVGLGLGRGAKASQHTIAPCSDAFLSAAIKSRTMNRVIASTKHILKEPQVSREPAITTPIVPDSHPVEDKGTFRKRVSHVLKRGLDSDPVISGVPPASKRGRSQCEAFPIASSQSAELSVAAETLLEASSVTARTRSKGRSALPTKPQKVVLLGLTNQSSPGNEVSQFESVQSKNLSCTAETIEAATSGSDTEPNTAVLREMSSRGTSQFCPEREKALTIPSETENNVLNEGARNRNQLPENSERSIVEEGPCSPDEEVRPPSPDVEESPRSPDLEESPRSPDLEESQKTAGSARTEEHQTTAFEFVLKELLQKSPPINKKVTKLKKDINLFVNRVFKNPDVTEESWNGLIVRAMRFDSINHPFILIRKLIASVIKDWDSPIDLSKTPPAPPMAPVHQRCVMILKELDEANSKLAVEPSDNLNMFSDLFLSESSAVMFQQDSSLTLEEMCSIARVYTAVCRSRASLTRARTFLFDCLYFMPPRSYALTYTIVSVWADVLRQISFPLGPSCIDQTAAYLLLHNCKIKAVPGIAGKVLQMRSFMQNTYGYKNVATKTIDDLVNYLMTRFKETNSADEASSLSWSLALLGRWEGIDFAIEVIEKQLWPFLQRWSSGEGTNSGAAAVIVAIGMLGKTVPPSKRAGVKRVLSAMKVLLQSDEVIPSIHEAAIEAVVLLGEDEDPKTVIEVVKAWKLVNTSLSQHLLKVLKAFLKRHSSLVLPSH